MLGSQRRSIWWWPSRMCRPALGGLKLSSWTLGCVSLHLRSLALVPAGIVISKCKLGRRIKCVKIGFLASRWPHLLGYYQPDFHRLLRAAADTAKSMTAESFDLVDHKGVRLADIMRSGGGATMLLFGHSGATISLHSTGSDFGSVAVRPSCYSASSP